MPCVRIYIYINVVLFLAGRPEEQKKKKWLMRSYISTFLRLSRLPILFFYLSPHRREEKVLSPINSISPCKWMNGPVCIDRSREFLISSNQHHTASFSSPSFSLLSSSIRYTLSCVLDLFLIAGHKGPTGVSLGGGVGSKSSMRTYIALCDSIDLKKEKKKKKRDKDIYKWR